MRKRLKIFNGDIHVWFWALSHSHLTLWEGCYMTLSLLTDSKIQHPEVISWFPDDSTLSSFIWTYSFFSSFARTILDCHDSFILNRRWYQQLLLIIWTSFKPIATSGNGCFSLLRRHPHYAGGIWKRRFSSENAFHVFCPHYARNWKRNNHPPCWISVWGKLGQENHVIIVTSSL